VPEVGARTSRSGTQRRAEPGERLVELGRIAGAHGLQGWLKLMSFTQPREGIFNYRPLYVGSRSFDEFEGRRRGNGLVIRFAGIEDRTAAEDLLDATVAVRRSQLPELEAGEYYWTDIEGLVVFDGQERRLGVVERVLPTGADPVLEVRGERKMLIPWVSPTYVTAIDLEAGRLLVDWDPDWV